MFCGGNEVRQRDMIYCLFGLSGIDDAAVRRLVVEGSEFSDAAGKILVVSPGGFDLERIQLPARRLKQVDFQSVGPEIRGLW